jgi:hypothetical protein
MQQHGPLVETHITSGPIATVDINFLSVIAIAYLVVLPAIGIGYLIVQSILRKISR